jgi:hypothetical protein
MAANTSAIVRSGIKTGKAWKTPPTVVITPVIDPRVIAEPRPVCPPSSDSASDRPMLIPAPSAVASPTSSAACEVDSSATAKIGASVDSVPSISPTRPGWT